MWATNSGLVMDVDNTWLESERKVQQRIYDDNDSFGDEWYIKRLLPTNGYELMYDEITWSGVAQNCNCYAYAINNQIKDSGEVWTKQQPGEYSGIILTNSSYTADGYVISRAVTSDFNEYNSNHDTNLIFMSIGRYETCPSNSYKVALVVDTTGEQHDYHWYRQDSDGLWSHKQGTTPVKRTDDAGELIIDPYFAERGEYTNFVGYFAVTPWNRYASNNDRLSYSNDRVNVIDNITIDIEKMSNIYIGMTYNEVVSFLGSKGEEYGCGAIVYRYTISNSKNVYINYCYNKYGTLVVTNIIIE